MLPTSPENRPKTIPFDRGWWATRDASGKSQTEINPAIGLAWSLK
jgi:putative spermidine/putrescine transport system substrate-binding protein